MTRRRFTLATRILAVIATSLPVAPALASSHIVDVAWSGAGRFEHSAPVAAGKFVELCARLDAGQKVQWTFEATLPMDFNIHYHVGKDTVYPVKPGELGRGSGVLSVAVAEVHCWMWTNKSNGPSSLRASLQK